MKTFYILLSAIFLFYATPIQSEDFQKTQRTKLKPDEKIICLVLTLENDEQMIESCLNSAIDVADCVCLCDKGSTDKTLEIAEELIRKSKIPAKVFRQKNKENGDGQLSSILAAKEMIAEFNYAFSSVYFLFLDADKLLVANKKFKKENVSNEEAYLILHNSLDFFFYRSCLVQASLSTEKIKKLCECPPSENPHPYKKITGLMVDDQLENPCVSEKITKNIHHFIQKLKDEPNNSHDIISLAQSYKSLKNYEEAINWHRSHIKICVSDEGFWFSNYKIAECYKELGRWDLGLQFYLEAFQYAPDRYEPMKKISEFYRKNHRHEIAYIYAKHASALELKRGHYLFTFNPTNTHEMDDELSLIAYYVKHADEGLSAVNRLLLMKNVPKVNKDLAYKNMLYYVGKLENAHKQPITIQLPQILKGTSLSYNAMNSSLRRTHSGYKMILRTVNYVQLRGCDFYCLDPTQIIKTKNFLVELDKDLKVISQNEIIDPASITKEFNPLLNRVSGMEDCRIVQSGNEDWYTCSTCETNPTGHIQITLCKLSNCASDQKIQVEKFIPLHGIYHLT